MTSRAVVISAHDKLGAMSDKEAVAMSSGCDMIRLVQMKHGAAWQYREILSPHSLVQNSSQVQPIMPVCL